MTIYDENKHPRGQADNAGQFRDKSNSGPEAALVTPAEPVWTPDAIAESVVFANYLPDDGQTAEDVLLEGLYDLGAGADDIMSLISAWASTALEARPEQTAPAFKPEGEPDYYRSQWHTLERNQATDLSDGEGGLYPWGKLSITAGTVQGHTKWLDITSSQARRILEILSSEAE